MSDKKPIFKPELNIPVQLEMTESDRFGFDPLEGETASKTILEGGKPKTLPASTYWMFNVLVDAKDDKVWFCYREQTAKLIVEMLKCEVSAGNAPRVALMEFADGKKHHLCLYAPASGYKVLPAHEVPPRFMEFCGAAATTAPAKPAASSGSSSTPANGSGKLDWTSAEEQMKTALTVSRKAWLAVLNESFTDLQKAEVDGDQVEMTKAVECHRILKEAAVAGIPASAHTMWIDVVAGRGRK